MVGMRPVVRLAVRRVLLGGRRSALEVGLVAVAVAAATELLGRTPVATGLAADVAGPLVVGLTVVVVSLALAAGEQERAAAAAVLVCNGASRRHQRTARVAEGLVLGSLGTAGGLALGVAVRPALGGGLTLDVVVLTAVLGFGATVVASLVGIRYAGRTPIPTLVQARRPARPVRPVAVAVAVGLVVVGTLIGSSARTWWDMSLAVTGGGTLLAIGAAVLASASLALLGPLARRAQGGMRLATVGLARERYRTGPVVALVTVATGVAFVGALLGSSFHVREERRIEALGHAPWARTLADDQLLIQNTELFGNSVGPGGLPADNARQLQAALPAGSVVAEVRDLELPPPPDQAFGTTVSAVRPPDGRDVGSPTRVAVGDGALLQAMGLDPALARQLAAGQALVLDPALVAHGRVHLRLDGDGPTFELPAVVTGVDRARSELPGVLVPPSVVGQHGVQPRSAGTLVRVPGGVSPAARQRVEDHFRLAQQDPSASVPAPFGGFAFSELVVPGPSDEWADGRLDSGGAVPDEREVQGLVVGALAVGVAVVTFALALATVERRRDDELLVVLGATAGVRRAVGAVQAGTLALLGAGVAIGLGTLATAFGFASYNGAGTGLPPIPFVFPWTVVLLLLVALPLAAAGLTSLLTPTIRSVDLHRLAD
jgi:putative ABC transport system permease protein